MQSVLIQALLPTVVALVGGWIAKILKTPTDHERASTLALIAEGAAAFVVSLNPKGDWATLLKSSVDQIAAASGLPTTNRAAIERAAAAALVKAGKAPA